MAEEATRTEVLDIDDLKAELVASISAAVVEKQASTVATMTATAIQKLFDAKKIDLTEHVQLEVRRKRKDEPTFTKQGTKEQYKHQRDILDTFEDVERQITKKDYPKAQEYIDQGKNLIGGRIKLINLAERETWQAVTEYQKDDLADDSDDDRRLSKAIKRAEAAKEKERTKWRRGNSRRGGRSRGFGRGGRYHSNYRPNFQRGPPHCYSCGMIGHMSWQCNQYNRQANPLLGKHTM